MTNKFGLHLHNGLTEKESMAEVGAGWYMVLDVDERVIPQLRVLNPGAKIALRLLGVGPTTHSPSIVADLCKDKWWYWKGHGLQFIQVGNEWNLSAEHRGSAIDWKSAEGYQIQLEWWHEFFQLMSKYPEVKIGGPALSPDYNFQLGWNTLAPILPKFDYIVLHSYGALSVDPSLLRQYPDKRFVVGEFNCAWNIESSVNKKETALWCLHFFTQWAKHPQMEALIYYQWDGPDKGPELGKGYNMVDSYELFTLFKTADKNPTISPPEPSSPTMSFWEAYQQKVGEVPALAKKWIENLEFVGWPIDGIKDGWPIEIRVGGHILLRCTMGVVWCKEGEYASHQIHVAYTEMGLPELGG